jgi:hypothetical protein
VKIFQKRAKRQKKKIQARPHESAQEGARCGTTVLEKAVEGGPYDAEGERRYFLSHEALKRAEQSGASGTSGQTPASHHYR